MSDDFQKELRFLGIESSPAFVRQPEGNGCIDDFSGPLMVYSLNLSGTVALVTGAASGMELTAILFT
jgi:hypothetical protein